MADCRADLVALKVLFQGEITEIESGHASVRRDLNVLSCQGHPMKLLAMSCRQVLRNRRGRLNVARSLGLFSSNVARKSKRSVNDAGLSTDDPPEAKVRRTGGSYRAFTSKASRGDPKGCCRPGLGREYRAQTPEERAEGNASGAHALELSHLGVERPFEQTEREIRRRELETQNAARMQRARDAVRSQLGLGSAGADGAASTSLPAGVTWDEGERRIIAGTRDASKLVQCKMEAVREVLVEHRAKMVQERGHHAAVMKSVGDSMGEEVQPTAQGPLNLDFSHVHGYFGNIQRVVSSVLKSKGTSYIGKATKQRLLSCWSRRNVHVQKECCATLSKRGDAYREAPCNTHQLCVEGRRGRLDLAMNASFNTVVRRHMFVTTISKKLGLGAKMFFLIEGRPALDSNAEVGIQGMGGNVHDEYALLWLHVGNVRQKPSLRLNVQAMACDDDPVPEKATVGLRGRWEFPSQLHVLRSLNKTWVWHLRAFVRDDTNRLVGRIRSHNVKATEFERPGGEVSSICFWNGSQAVVKALRAKLPPREAVPMPNDRVEGAAGDAPVAPMSLGVAGGLGDDKFKGVDVSHLDKADADEYLADLEGGGIPVDCPGGGGIPVDENFWDEVPSPWAEPAVGPIEEFDPFIDVCPAEPGVVEGWDSEYSPEYLDDEGDAAVVPIPDGDDIVDGGVTPDAPDEEDGKGGSPDPLGDPDDPDGPRYDGADAVVCEIPDIGSITFYPAVGDFYAVCKPHGGRCRTVRTNTGAADKLAQGRPIGFLGAWLLLGSFESSVTNMKSHRHDDAFVKCDVGSRIYARNLIKTLPGGIKLLRCERGRRAGEPHEPVDRP